jgi:hypothetical protein
MQELRAQLADARGRLRGTKDAYELAKAEAEQRAIEAGCNGKNAEERGRSLLVAVSKDDQYLVAKAQLRYAENEVERLDALLEGARDARRYDEWQIRARLADALLQAGVQSDGDSGAEGAFDDGMDAAVDEEIFAHDRTEDNGMSNGSLNSSHYAGKRRPQPTYSMLEQDEELPF